MKSISYRLLGLQLYLSVSRMGWAPVVIAMTTGTALILWLSLIPYMQSVVDTQQQELQRSGQALHHAETAAPVAPLSLAATHAEAFYNVLGESFEVEKKVGVMFTLAEKAGLFLHQADYKTITDSNGYFHAYQVQLPVIGSYSAIRQFCESALLSIPFASLDEMSFRREAISNGQLEAKLRFTLYLSNKDRPAKPALAMREGEGA